MTVSAPFNQYAAFYDILYEDKDYKGEAAYVAALLRRFIERKPQDIAVLDLACGTGRHAFELADLGFSVEGSDLSAEMIGQAKAAAQKKGANITFHNFSFQNIEQVGKKYDAVISMFSAINYLTDLGDLTLTLRNIASLLSPGGIFVFDYWNAHAVVRDYSPVRVLKRKAGDREIMRISETTVDAAEQLARIKFTCTMHENDLRKFQFEEVHHIRFFYLRQMDELLRLHGFEPVYVSPFMKLDQAIDLYDWNITVVCKSRS